MIRINIIYSKMIDQIFNYFSIDILYYWVNLGVLPFWLILIFFPHSQLCKYFVTSIFPIFLLSGSYIFMLYKAFLSGYDFFGNFNLYFGIENIADLFSSQTFLIMFWIHFLSINLFAGGWIVKDSQRFSINRFLIIFPLLITYLIGPIGLFLYWLIRIFYSKSINLYD
tara:strand:- start:57 stop:560 length:504 start_codon:yes stop_codon:yes gene_type:complete